jgi:hypothetical protein
MSVAILSIASPAERASGALVETDPALEQTCVEAVTIRPDPFELTRTFSEGGMTPIHGYQLQFHSVVRIGLGELPDECRGAFRATFRILARYKDSKHTGWWLDAGGGAASRGADPKARLDSFILSSRKEVGCFEAVRLSASVKVLNLANGATAARRSFRRPAQPLTCGGQPVPSRPLAAFGSVLPSDGREIDPTVEAECIEVATALPTSHETSLRFRAKVPRGNNKREGWVVKFFTPALGEECWGFISRSLLVNIQIQDPDDPARWHPMYKRNRGWQFWSNDPDAEWLGRGWHSNGERTWLTPGTYECSPGRHETEARILLKARAHHPGPGQPLVAQRSYEVPVKVTGGC